MDVEKLTVEFFLHQIQVSGFCVLPDVIPQNRCETICNSVVRTVQEVERHLSSAPADLVVLPELSSVDYSREAFSHLEAIAEDLHGPSFEAWSAVARKFASTVVFGIPRIAEDGYRISQLAVGPDGNLIGYFDKIHLAQYGASMEKEYFKHAGQLFVFEVNGVRVAPIVCYDIRFPELSRTLCLDHSVDLILHCGAYARDESFYSWHHFVVARALENQVYVLSLNRAGDDFGASLFCPPWIDASQPESQFGNAEKFLRFNIETELIRSVRQQYSFLADRLDDYSQLPAKVCPPDLHPKATQQ